MGSSFQDIATVVAAGLVGLLSWGTRLTEGVVMWHSSELKPWYGVGPLAVLINDLGEILG